MSFEKAFVPEFDEEMQNTRKMLERVPEDKLDYKPHEKSMSLGRLASHVAELPGWAVNVIDKEVLDMQPGEFKPVIAKSRKELLEMFDKSVAEARKRIVGASEEDLQKTWTFKFGGNPVFSAPRARILRTTMLNHIIHHRAQLSVYLRLNNVELPGMYGPSADEMKFWEPAPEKATA